MSFASLRTWLLALCAVVLVSCGGGSSSDAGTPILGLGGSGSGSPILGGGGSGTSNPVASSLVLTLSSPTIANNGSQTVTATAVALDANNNTLPGVPVTIAADSAVVTPSGKVTDATGTITGSISLGSNSTNRTINISATSGSIKQTKTLDVVDPSGSAVNTPAALSLALSSTSVSSGSPATVTARLTDTRGNGVPGQVVSFSVVRGLAVTNVGTALTGSDPGSVGVASVVLMPVNSTTAGADEVTASVSFGGTTLTSTAGFQIQATNVTLSSFTSSVATLGAYGQTTLTVSIAGASVGSPVNVTVTSSCVSQGKATLSPSTFTATTTSVDLQYKDAGCGAVQAQDKLQAAITGSSSTPLSLSLPIAVPAAASLAFISASPEVIYIKGSGFTESSTVTFQVRDGAGNPLPGQSVSLALLTQAGGVTIEGGTTPVTQVSDANGQVTAQVNSGTVPTPVRVSASLVATPSIATVSSNLSIAVGLPSELNFSLSQQTRNIEGFNIDGTPNTYNIIASDRNGNPVAAGTSINFVAEGGQIEAIKQIQIVSGIGRTSAAFVSADPRPADGRVTITAYALGEESFIDQNGNNTYDPGEPFQDLGNIFKDRNFDGVYDPAVDEYIPTNIANTSACSAPGAASGATTATNALLALDPSIPSVGGNTCDGVWSGAGKVYVRRAIETVLSTSVGRPLWLTTSGLDNSCGQIKLQIGPNVGDTYDQFVPVRGDTWHGGISSSFSLIVADANPGIPKQPFNNALTDYIQFPRLNPMAARTAVSVSTTTLGLTVQVASGSPVPSTTEASSTGIAYSFDPKTAVASADGFFDGVVLVTFTSPSGTSSSVAINVTNRPKTSSCPR